MEKQLYPNYEIISYELNPPIEVFRFGAKAKVQSDYSISDEDPFNKKIWGQTRKEAERKVKEAIEKWISDNKNQ